MVRQQRFGLLRNASYLAADLAVEDSGIAGATRVLAVTAPAAATPATSVAIGLLVAGVEYDSDEQARSLRCDG